MEVIPAAILISYLVLTSVNHLRREDRSFLCRLLHCPTTTDMIQSIKDLSDLSIGTASALGRKYSECCVHKCAQSRSRESLSRSLTPNLAFSRGEAL